MKISTHTAAQKNRITHSFLPGLGYIDHAREAVQHKGPDKTPCQPGFAAADGSVHVLMPPTGAETQLRWKNKAWVHPTSPTKGNRMGWSAQYLGNMGWAYVGPAA
jgi:hypothetical protein